MVFNPSIVDVCVILAFVVSAGCTINIVSLPIAQVKSFTTYSNETYYILPQPNPEHPPASFRVGFYLQAKSNSSDLSCNAYIGNEYLPTAESNVHNYIGFNKNQEIWITLPYFNSNGPLPLWFISLASQSSTYSNSRCTVSVYIFGTCINECNGAGMCDSREGSCKCDSEYYGIACEYPKNVQLVKNGIPAWALVISALIFSLPVALLCFFFGRHFGYRSAYTLK
eukprot:Phypoly_transcript_15234.p1 GENE.Phypoly_transcript_15234~~Phypoly_transcript_15234.p1  ORF type:complete len:225 (+),score=10.41 Phypoly_transcript_15234:116-790(+)